MSMKVIKKAVCVTGKYTDRKTGTEKNQYLTVGKLMQREDGSLSLKLDAVPVGFDGWINFYELEQAGATRPHPSDGTGQVSQAPQGNFAEDDIPF